MSLVKVNLSGWGYKVHSSLVNKINTQKAHKDKQDEIEGQLLLEHALHVFQDDVHPADEKRNLARQDCIVVCGLHVYVCVVAVVYVLLCDGLLERDRKTERDSRQLDGEARSPQNVEIRELSEQVLHF